MSTKQKCHQNLNVTKTEMSLKLKCQKLSQHQNLNVTITEVLPKLRCHQNKKWPQNQITIQEIGTDCLGLVLV